MSSLGTWRRRGATPVWPRAAATLGAMANAAETPLRRDAARNRDRLLEAARTAFAEVGIDVPLEEIARRAGVGIATLYRRFPSREALLGAVAVEVVAEYAAVAEAALAEPDPWRGFSGLVEGACAIQARDHARRAVLAGVAHSTEAAAEELRARELVGRVVRRAQEHGAVRPDVTWEDVYLVLWGNARVIEVASGVAPELWRRFVGLILEGFRAQAAAAPLPAPALAPAELAAALAALRGTAGGGRAGA